MRVEALCDMSVFLDLKGFVCGEYVHNVGIGRSLRLSTGSRASYHCRASNGAIAKDHTTRMAVSVKRNDEDSLTREEALALVKAATSPGI